MRAVHDNIHNIAYNTSLGAISLAHAIDARVREQRHGMDLQAAQRLVNNVAAREAAANDDYYEILAELVASHRENAVLRSALEESDAENLRLSLKMSA